MLLLLMGILSKAQGTNIDDNAQIQSNKRPVSILLGTPLYIYYHLVALGAHPLVGVLDMASAKMCRRKDAVL